MVSIGDQSRWVEGGMEKLRYLYFVKPEDECIDLGSYRREWADEMIKRYGCKVDCWDALDNRAAWTHDGELEMGGFFYYTSLYTDGVKIKTKCFDIAPHLGKEIAVLKINIEGGEYDLLEYIISKGLHKNIKNIQVQFHVVNDFDYMARYEKIRTELRETHLITWRVAFVWENWARI